MGQDASRSDPETEPKTAEASLAELQMARIARATALGEPVVPELEEARRLVEARGLSQRGLSQGGPPDREHDLSQARLAAQEAKARGTAVSESAASSPLTEGAGDAAEGEQRTAVATLDEVESYWARKRRGSADAPLSREYWLSEEKWECQQCGYLNPPPNDHCRKCEAKRPEQGDSDTVLPFLAGKAIAGHVEAIGTPPPKAASPILDESGQYVGAYLDEFELADTNKDGVLDRAEFSRLVEAKAAVDTAFAAPRSASAPTTRPQSGAGQAETRLRELVGWAYQRDSPSRGGVSCAAQPNRNSRAPNNCWTGNPRSEP